MAPPYILFAFLSQTHGAGCSKLWASGMWAKLISLLSSDAPCRDGKGTQKCIFPVTFLSLVSLTNISLCKPAIECDAPRSLLWTATSWSVFWTSQPTCFMSYLCSHKGLRLSMAWSQARHQAMFSYNKVLIPKLGTVRHSTSNRKVEYRSMSDWQFIPMCCWYLEFCSSSFFQTLDWTYVACKDRWRWPLSFSGLCGVAFVLLLPLRYVFPHTLQACRKARETVNQPFRQIGVSRLVIHTTLATRWGEFSSYRLWSVG